MVRLASPMRVGSCGGTSSFPSIVSTMLFGTFWAFALGFALWFNWSHWVDLSHHWTQRDQYWVYYRMRHPDEPITAFLMNWRGETFYSKNTVRQIGRAAAPTVPLQEFLNGPGNRKWFLVEQGRRANLRQAIGGAAKLRLVESRMSKFALAVAERDMQGAPAQIQAPPPPTGLIGAPP